MGNLLERTTRKLDEDVRKENVDILIESRGFEKKDRKFMHAYDI